MKRSVRKSFKWLLVLGMIAGLLGALLPTGPAAAGTLSFSTTSLAPTTGMVVSDMIKGPGNDHGRNVLAVSPNYASDSRIWAALDSDGDSIETVVVSDPENSDDDDQVYWRVGTQYRLGEALSDAETEGTAELPDDARIVRRTAYASGQGVDEVAYSSNGGLTWTDVDPGRTDNSPIVAIVPSPLYASDNTVLVASTMFVYRSTNGGGSYTRLGSMQGSVETDGTVSLQVTSVAVSPTYSGVGEIAIGLADPRSGVVGCPAGPDGDDDCVRVWGRSGVLAWDSIASSDMAADVTAVAYSPSYSADGVMMVVGSAATAGDEDSDIAHIMLGTAVYHLQGPGAAWNVGLGGVSIDTGLLDVGAGTDGVDGIINSALAVPSDYDGSDSAKRVVYLGTNSNREIVEDTGAGADGIYRVTGTAGTRRTTGGTETDVSNIAVAGTVSSLTVIVSSASVGNAAYRTTNFTSGSSSPTFGSTPRPVPGGDDDAASSTVVGISPDGGTAFALANSAFTPSGDDPPVPVEDSYAPSGNGSFSRSADGGKSYAQVSLLNNGGAFTFPGLPKIDAADEDTTGTVTIPAVAAADGVPAAAIEGFAVSPDFDASAHMLAAVSGRGSDVTLYSDNGGARWMVVNTGDFAGNAIAFAYSPDFATDNTIYSAALGTQRLMRSTNGGLSWSQRSGVACGGNRISSIAAADASTVLVGCENGTVRRSVNGGFLFRNASGTASGEAVSDIALSPSYADDNSILIGQSGEARLSTNGGSSFSRLGSSAGTGAAGTGATQVAFHSDYATNSMVYAGNDKAYRWTVGSSSSWKSIPGAANVVGLGVGSDGTLYAASEDEFTLANSTADPAVTAMGGVFSSADPTASSPRLVQVGVPASGGDNLDSGEVVSGFAHTNTGGSERLWVSITDPLKADNWRHYTDTIGSMLRPTGLTPADGAVVGASDVDGRRVTGFTIGWNAVVGATEYTYQWGTSSTFSSPCGASTTGRSVADTAICGENLGRPGNTTYYWRVQVSKPVVGPWSAAQSLTTALIAGVQAGLPTLSQPKAGNLAPETSREVPLRPLFVWTGVNGATQYDLQVSTDGTFLDPNQMVVDRTGSNRLGNQIAFQSDVQLSPGTVYFWRVRGVSATSMGGYPPAAAFTTTSAAAATGRPAGQALAALEATGNLEVVTGYDYASGLWQSYVPGLPGNSLATIQPNSVLFITVMEDTTVIVSGVAYNIAADTPTPVPVGAAVTVVVQ